MYALFLLACILIGSLNVWLGVFATPSGSTTSAFTLYPTECEVDPRHRDEFRAAAHRYLGSRHPADWCYLAAQQVAECSHDCDDAVSSAGAKGHAQFMQKTWDEQAKLAGVEGSPFDKSASIKVQASYMGRLADQFSKRPRGWHCKRELAAASYNAGLGNVLRAQELSGDRLCWRDIVPFMAKVTGAENALETIGYVARIGRIAGRLVRKNRK